MNEIEVVDTRQWVNIQVDSQLLSAFMSCPRYFWYRYQRHLESLGGTKPAYEEGSLVHAGMQGFYTALMDGSDPIAAKAHGLAAARRKAPTLDNVKPESIMALYLALEEYFNYRQNDIANFRILAVEKHFQLVAYEEYPLRVILCGKIDLITQEYQSGLIIPYDHKKEAEARFYSATSNQFKIYCIACGANSLVVNRFGLQKSYGPDKKYKRDQLQFDSQVLEEFKTKIIPHYVKEMLICMENEYYPPNFTSCIDGYFACDYSDRKDHKGICTVDPQYREEKLLKYFRVGKEWNPAAE